MPRTKIVRTDREIECSALDDALRELGDELVLLPGAMQEAELIEATRDAELLLTCYAPITANVIHAARHLKGIVKYGVGIDAIDILAARKRRIPVANVPAYADETVAECAFSLMLALAKKLVPITTAMHSSGWLEPCSEWLGSDIAGKSVGLVGVGRIGRCMARMVGQGFRARVCGYDPYVPGVAMHGLGIEKFDDLTAMMAACDFVSIHCVLTAETKRLIGEQELRAMKSTSMLINVSRGAIVDEQALVRAISEKWIAGAGLDVYAHEPLCRTGHPLSHLLDCPNVITLPHLAFYTAEAMNRLTIDTLARCKEILNGQLVTIRSTDPRLRQQECGVRVLDLEMEQG